VFHKFIKKIFGKVEVTPQIAKEEKVSFEKIDDWLKDKEKDVRNKEEVIYYSIKEKILSFVNDVDKKLPVLEDVNIDSVNSVKRINAIVKAGLNNYVSHIKTLSKNLKELDDANLDGLIKKIIYLFSDFDKKTYVNYQKASVLVGRELTDLHDSIVNFSNFFTKILDENKELLESSKMIFVIKDKLCQIEKVNENIYELSVRIKSINTKITSIKERTSKMSGYIEEIKKSDSYLENQKKLDALNLEEKEFLDELYKLKQDIDFKVLGNLYHVSEKKMSIVRKYRDDFSDSFLKDNGLEFTDLLLDAKLSTDEITSKIKVIIDKKNELDQNKSQITPDETKELSSKIRSQELELTSAIEEKDKEIERRKKLEDNKSEIIDSIKLELEKIHVKLI
jgi:hypothetical protein